MEKSEALSKFKLITNCDDERARFYLESSDNNLETALGNFYNEQDTQPEDESEDVPTSAPAPEIAPRTVSKKPAPKPSGNVRTLASLSSQADDSDSDDDERGQAFYAGGSEHSGQQVLGPPRERSSDMVTNMFRAARQRGAEVVTEAPARGSRLFRGTGYRLGETESDSQVVKDPDAENEELSVRIRFWRNGFTVDDGPVRLLSEEANQQFMAHVLNGRIPPELAEKYAGRDVHVSLEDHRHEGDAKVTSGAKSFFGGAGRKLGSPTPTLSSPVTPTAPESDDSTVPAEPIVIDESQPITSVQIRLADGTRLVGRFNHAHTVGDIRSFINTSHPQYRTRNYSLLSSFPRKELSCNEDSIEKCGLLNSVVMQQLKA